MSVLRNCVCCGKEYEFCPGCHRKDQPAWMTTFCSEPCKELFNIISAFNVKRMSKADVRKYAIDHNINSSKYTAPVKRVLDAAMEAETSNVSDEKKSAPVTTALTEEKKDEKKAKAVPSPAIRAEHKAAIATDGNNLEHRSRRNRKRRTRQLDIDLT